MHINICIHIHVYVYIYIYIYIVTTDIAGPRATGRATQAGVSEASEGSDSDRFPSSRGGIPRSMGNFPEI